MAERKPRARKNEAPKSKPDNGSKVTLSKEMEARARRLAKTNAKLETSIEMMDRTDQDSDPLEYEVLRDIVALLSTRYHKELTNATDEFGLKSGTAGHRAFMDRIDFYTENI